MLLAACSQETDLMLRKNEHWEWKNQFTFNFDLLPDIGGDVIEGIDLSFSTGAFGEAGIEMALDQAVAYYEAQGMDVNWNKDRSFKRSGTTYVITIKGEGWDSLSRMMKPDQSYFNALGDMNFQDWGYDISVSNLSDGQIQFTMQAPEDTIGLMMIFPVKFRLHGGDIISSNANKVTGGVATWINPQGRMEAVLTPASSLSAGLIRALLIAAGIIGVLAIILILIRSTRRRSRHDEDSLFESDWNDFY